MSGYFCFNDCPVPSKDKWRHGADCSPIPRLCSRLDKWSIIRNKEDWFVFTRLAYLFTRQRKLLVVLVQRLSVVSPGIGLSSLFFQHITRKLFLQHVSTSEAPQLSLFTWTEIRGYFWNLSFYKSSLFYKFPKAWLFCMYAGISFIHSLFNDLITGPVCGPVLQAP